MIPSVVAGWQVVSDADDVSIFVTPGDERPTSADKVAVDLVELGVELRAEVRAEFRMQTEGISEGISAQIASPVVLRVETLVKMLTV